MAWSTAHWRRVAEAMDARSALDSRSSISALARLISHLARAGGFTIDPRNGMAPSFSRRDFVVSLAGREAVYRIAPRAAEVGAWLSKVKSALEPPSRFVGGWMSDLSGLYYLDVSTVVRGLECALTLAASYGQQAIFHPTSGRTIYLHEDHVGGRSDCAQQDGA